MNYTLLIHNLHIDAEHGLLPEEYGKKQAFVVTAEVTSLFNETLARNDDFDDGVCYANIYKAIHSRFKNYRYRTLEALVLALNADVLALHTGFTSITTSILKATIFHDCEVGVQLTSVKK